jgi:hypothetical protein
MKEEAFSNKIFISSAVPLSAFVDLVGGEGLSEKPPRLATLSDSPSPPTSQNHYLTEHFTYDNVGNRLALARRANRIIEIHDGKVVSDRQTM